MKKSWLFWSVLVCAAMLVGYFFYDRNSDTEEVAPSANQIVDLLQKNIQQHNTVNTPNLSTGSQKIVFTKADEETYVKGFLASYNSLPPAGISQKEWHQLHAALVGHPDGINELKRITGFMQTQKKFDELVELNKTNRVPTEYMKSLATSMSDGLEDRVKEQQINPLEALSVKTLALNVLEPDTKKRQAELLDWAKKVDASLPVHTTDPRDAEYAKAQTEVTANWAKNYSPSQTDELDRQLTALRVKIYGNK